MGMQSGGNNNMPMSEINVTPLVDVMLVLLIIFMVTAPHLDKGIQVDLPKVAVGNGPASTPDDMVIKITKDSEVYIDEKPVKIDKRLSPVIKERLAVKSQKVVYIRADKDVAYGTVVRVMAAAKDAGVISLSMVTEEEEIEKP